MKKVKFQRFLETNNIKKTALPKPLQDKIDIFWQLHELQDAIQDADRQDLLDQIKELDYEILGNIEEQYEDQLENNERIQELVKSPFLKPEMKKKLKSKVSTNETIVQELFDMGRIENIGRSELREMGWKGEVKNYQEVGRFIVKRTAFWFYLYSIYKK